MAEPVLLAVATHEKSKNTRTTSDGAWRTSADGIAASVPKNSAHASVRSVCLHWRQLVNHDDQGQQRQPSPPTAALAHAQQEGRAQQHCDDVGGGDGDAPPLHQPLCLARGKGPALAAPTVSPVDAKPAKQAG